MDDDPFIRDQINAACAEADALARDHELWKAKRAQREQVKTKSLNDGNLIFKRRENALVQSQPTTTMTPEAQKPWDQWCDARIERFMHNVFIDATVEFVGDYTHRHLKPLREEVAKLRAELDTLKRSKASKARSRKNGR